MIGWGGAPMFSWGFVHFGGGLYSSIARLVNILKKVDLRKHLSINNVVNPEKYYSLCSEAKIRLILFI